MTSEFASIAEVQALVLEAASPLPPRVVPLAEAQGLALSEAVVAINDAPPYDNSAMDGYALRAGDLRGDRTRLEVVARTMAGDVASGLTTGQAVRIMTGAPVPSGADTVVRIEDTSNEDDSTVTIEKAPARGDNIRLAGEDIARGSVALAGGTVVGAAQIALLASVGATKVPVYPRPRVGVLSTGDELARDDGPLGAGRIRDANRPALIALVREAGCEPVDLGVVGDDEDEIAAAMEAALGAVDALVTSGGVSAGDRDRVAGAMERVAGKVHSFDVAMRPGRPFSYAVAEGKPLFGLAGNPAAALLGFELFTRPAIRSMAGHAKAARPRLAAVADEALTRRPDPRVHFVRVAVRIGEDGLLHVRSAGRQNPHLLTTTAAAAGLVALPEGPGAQAGDRVELLVLDWDQVERS